MSRIAKRLARYRWSGLLAVWAVFLMIAFVLFAERSGVQYSASNAQSHMLSAKEAVPASTAIFDAKTECLVIVDSRQSGVKDAKKQFDRILLDMKVAHRDVDLAKTDVAGLPAFERYRYVVVLSPSVDVLGDKLVDLMSWVKAGGNLMLGMTPEATPSFKAVSAQLGVASVGDGFVKTESIVPSKDFMLGGGERYDLTDPFESSLAVTLRDSAHVCARSGDKGAPLIWSNEDGRGRAVVCNIGIYTKAMRGFYAQAMSLLGDAFAYPVINSSVFFLDDFPSPVPSGDGTYIKRDYGLSTADFYSKVWWPDLQKLAQRYGIRFTGVMIENYGDDTSGKTVRQADTSQFHYYGGMLLQMGGEVGYHGYNHQPLALSDTDYHHLYAYKTWASKRSLVQAMDELIAFQDEVLPNSNGSVYVPPSNILSPRARRVLGRDVKRIKTIASTYFDDGTGFPYVQEFGVADDGVVEEPRIVSGCMVGDSYMRLAALSELNMHYVSTHFMHPDDLLDPDRGATLGWERYKAGLTDFLDWLDSSAPDLRRQTATECAGAIQRFSSVTVSLSSSDSFWKLKLGNFHDEAWLFFRANEGEPGRVTGGELEHLDGNLYLLKASSANVTIERREGDAK